MSDATANPQNKDRLFKKIFGSEDHKAWTLSLYNAVNGSSYTDPDKIEYNTIDEFLYLGYHNDVSFIIGETINLYEHQSTYNPNLPLRFLIYVGKTYAKYVSTENNIDIYRRKREIVPVPKFICFYNGSEKRPETEIMRFSDLLPQGSDSDIEITVNVLNINPEYNTRLLEACQALKEYSLFTAAIRKNVYSNGMKLEAAIEKAVKDMPDNALLKPFLLAHLAEVIMNIYNEWNEELRQKNLRNDLKEEVREEVIEEVREELTEEITEKVTETVTKNVTVTTHLSSLRSLMSTLHCTPDEAMNYLGITDQRDYYKQLLETK